LDFATARVKLADLSSGDLTDGQKTRLARIARQQRLDRQTPEGVLEVARNNDWTTLGSFGQELLNFVVETL